MKVLVGVGSAVICVAKHCGLSLDNGSCVAPYAVAFGKASQVGSTTARTALGRIVVDITVCPLVVLHGATSNARALNKGFISLAEEALKVPVGSVRLLVVA